MTEEEKTVKRRKTTTPLSKTVYIVRFTSKDICSLQPTQKKEKHFILTSRIFSGKNLSS